MPTSGKRGRLAAAAAAVEESPSADEEEQSPRRRVGGNLFKRLFFCYADEEEDEDESDTDEESEDEVEEEKKPAPRLEPRILEPKVSQETRHYALQPQPLAQEVAQAVAPVVVVPAAQPLSPASPRKTVETQQAEVAAPAEPPDPPPVPAAAATPAPAAPDPSAGSPSAASTAVVPAEPQRPDFTGAWILDRFEGDMNAYAAASGVPWAARKMAGSMGWGVGKSVIKFAHNGNRTVIISETPRGTQVQDLVVNGEKQQVPHLMTGEPIEVTPYWEGDCLVVDTPTEKIRRSLRAGELLVDMQTFKGGVHVVRIHKKR